MKALVLGGFDILHWGHVAFLKRASQFGSITVGLSTDALLEATKRTPIFTYQERKQGLEALGYDVLNRDQIGARRLFEYVRPDYYVCGNDWADTGHLLEMGIDMTLLNELDVTVVYVPRPWKISTSEILERAWSTSSTS